MKVYKIHRWAFPELEDAMKHICALHREHDITFVGDGKVYIGTYHITTIETLEVISVREKLLNMLRDNGIKFTQLGPAIHIPLARIDSSPLRPTVFPLGLELWYEYLGQYVVPTRVDCMIRADRYNQGIRTTGCLGTLQDLMLHG